MLRRSARAIESQLAKLTDFAPHYALGFSPQGSPFRAVNVRALGPSARRKVHVLSFWGVVILSAALALAWIAASSFDAGAARTVAGAVWQNVLLWAPGGILFCAVFLAFGLTAYPVFLLARAVNEPRQLDRERWIADRESELTILERVRPVDRQKARAVRDLLDAARTGDDGAPRIFLGRLLRAWTFVAFPLAAVPLALVIILHAIVPGELPLVDDVVTYVTSTFEGEVNLDPVQGADVPQTGSVRATATIAVVIPAATGIISPIMTAVLLQLRVFLDNLSPYGAGWTWAYLGLLVGVFSALWAATWIASQVALKAGGGRRADWKVAFEDAWKSMLPPAL